MVRNILRPVSIWIKHDDPQRIAVTAFCKASLPMTGWCRLLCPVRHPPQLLVDCLSRAARRSSPHGHESRETIYGASIRAAAERATEARKEADRLACEVQVCSPHRHLNMRTVLPLCGFSILRTRAGFASQVAQDGAGLGS